MIYSDSTWADNCNFGRYSHCGDNGIEDFEGRSCSNCLNVANLVCYLDFVGLPTTFSMDHVLILSNLLREKANKRNYERVVSHRILHIGSIYSKIE